MKNKLYCNNCINEGMREGMDNEICEICSKILNVDRVKKTDNFILLGGSSLQIPELLYAIKKTFNVLLTAEEVLNSNDIKEIGDIVSKKILQSESKSTKTVNLIKSKSLITAPVSSSQKQIWISEKLDDCGKQAKVTFTIKITGRCDYKKLKASIISALKSEAAYNSIFYLKDGQVFAEYKEVTHSFFEHKGTFKSSKECHDAINNIIKKTHFALESGILYQVDAFKINNLQQIFLFQFHHIIFDQASVKLLWEKIVNIYESDIENKDINFSYFEYLKVNRDKQEGERVAATKKAWKLIYSNAEKIKILWPQQSKSEKNKQNRIYGEILEKNKVLPKYPISVILAESMSEALVRYFKYSKNSSFNIGVPYANRTISNINVQGNFVNILPMEVNFDNCKNVDDKLMYINSKFKEMYNCQQVSFQDMLDNISLPNYEYRYKFIQTVFVYSQKIELKKIGNSTKVSFKECIQSPNDFPLIVYFEDNKEKINVIMDYDEGLLTLESAKSILKDIVNNCNKLKRGKIFENRSR